MPVGLPMAIRLRVRYVPAARLVLLKGLFPSLSTRKKVRLSSKIGGVASHFDVITIICLPCTKQLVNELN